MAKYTVLIDDRRIKIEASPDNPAGAAEKACELYYNDNPEETGGIVKVTVIGRGNKHTKVTVEGKLVWKATDPK